MTVAAGKRTDGRTPKNSRSPRTAHRSRCTLRVRDSIGQLLTETGETVNISPQGIAIQLARPLAAGAAVEVELAGEPVVGKVAHSRRVSTGTFEIGIQLEPPARAT